MGFHEMSWIFMKSSSPCGESAGWWPVAAPSDAPSEGGPRGSPPAAPPSPDEPVGAVGVRPERPLGPGLGLTCNEARSVRHALGEWVANHADASSAWTREYQDMALRCVILEYNIDDSS